MVLIVWLSVTTTKKKTPNIYTAINLHNPLLFVKYHGNEDYRPIVLTSEIGGMKNIMMAGPQLYQ